MQKEAGDTTYKPDTIQQDLDLTIPVLPLVTTERQPSSAYVELKPDLVKHKKAESDLEAFCLRNAVKRNVGTFFTNVYMGLFPESGYEIAPRHRIQLATGEWRELNPDLVQRCLLGDKLIEVKGVTTMNSKTKCFVNQAEDYFYTLLRELAKGADRPVVRYSIFRYGGSHDMLNLHSYDEAEAMRILARNPKDALVLSTNQALLLFMLSKSERREHASIDNAKHFVLTGSAITLLHDPRSKDIGYFLDAYEERFRHNLESQRKQGHVLPDSVKPIIRNFRSAIRFAKQGFMHLDDLKYEQFPSDRNAPLVFRDVTLPQFPVTVYSIRNYDSWIADFGKYHERILKKAGLRDLFAEEQRYKARRGRLKENKASEDDIPF